MTHQLPAEFFVSVTRVYTTKEYLEEDQDAATFIQRLKDNQIQPVWRHYYNKTRYSRIRNYSPLQPI